MAPGAIILPGASTNPDFDIAQLQDTQNGHERRVQRPLRLQAEHNGRPTSASSTIRGEHRARRGHRPALQIHRTTRPTRSSTCRDARDATINEFKFGYNARTHTHTAGPRPSTASTSRTSLINFTRHGRQHGIAGQGNFGCRQCRAVWFAPTARQRPRRTVRPVLADVRRLDDRRAGQPYVKFGARRPRSSG